MRQVKNIKTQVWRTLELAFSRGRGRHSFKAISCADTGLRPGRQQTRYPHLLVWRTVPVELIVLLCLWWENPCLEELVDKWSLNREMTRKGAKTRRDKVSCIMSFSVPKRSDPLIFLQSLLCPHHRIPKKIFTTWKHLLISITLLGFLFIFWCSLFWHIANHGLQCPLTTTTNPPVVYFQDDFFKHFLCDRETPRQKRHSHPDLNTHPPKPASPRVTPRAPVANDTGGLWWLLV